jgi:hypothetical protein
MCGVGIRELPKQAMSPNPRSSIKIMTTFGFRPEFSWAKLKVGLSPAAMAPVVAVLRKFLLLGVLMLQSYMFLWVGSFQSSITILGSD